MKVNALRAKTTSQHSWLQNVFAAPAVSLGDCAAPAQGMFATALLQKVQVAGGNSRLGITARRAETLVAIAAGCLDGVGSAGKSSRGVYLQQTQEKRGEKKIKKNRQNI